MPNPFFGVGLMQVNPERYGNVILSCHIKTPVVFIGPQSTVFCMNFLDKYMHFSKEWSAVFTKVFAHVEGPLESNAALSKHFCCGIAGSQV